MSTDESALWLGQSRDDDAPVELPVTALLRHVMALGSSGSGKTVLSKIVVEEVVRRGLPVIAVDPQGDLCSLALEGDAVALQDAGVDPALAAEFRDKADVVVFTPASTKGVPICADPIPPGLADLSGDERLQVHTRTSQMIVALLGYDVESDDGAGLAAVLDEALGEMATAGRAPTGLADLAEYLDGQSASGFKRYLRYLDAKRIRTACQRLARLDVGARRLLFHQGVPIDIDLLLGRGAGAMPGKTRVSVVYLNTLHSAEDREFFIASLAERLYAWMLRHPSKEPQAVFYIDEVAPYVPPVRKPACKESLQLLFKQARKYGVGCLMATQNPGDVDYKAMAQFGSWALGRLTTRQDLKKLEPTIKALDPIGCDAILGTLPKQRPGEFVLLSPDHFDEACRLRSRWLFSRHTTLDEDQVEELADGEAGFRGRFEGLVRGSGPRGPDEGAPEVEPVVGAEAQAEPVVGAEAEVEPVVVAEAEGIADGLVSTASEAAMGTTPGAPSVPSDAFGAPVSRAPRTLRIPQLAEQAPTLGAPEPAPAATQLVAPPRDHTAYAPAPVASPAPAPAPPAPVASSAPAPQAPPVDPRRADLEALATVLAGTTMASARDFAAAAGVSESKARATLRELVEGGLARSHKEGRRQVYWAVANGARPDIGLGPRVLAAALGVGRSAVEALAREHQRQKLFGVLGEAEHLSELRLEYRLVTRVDFEEQVERQVLGGLMAPTTDHRLGSVYLHPRTLDILSLTKEGVRFTDKPAERASDVPDLDGQTTVGEQPPIQLPLVEDDLATAKPDADAARSLRARYALTTSAVYRVFVPVWRLLLSRDGGAGYRVIHLDGLVGRPVDWPPARK